MNVEKFRLGKRLQPRAFRPDHIRQLDGNIETVGTKRQTRARAPNHVTLFFITIITAVS